MDTIKDDKVDEARKLLAQNFSLALNFTPPRVQAEDYSSGDEESSAKKRKARRPGRPSKKEKITNWNLNNSNNNNIARVENRGRKKKNAETPAPPVRNANIIKLYDREVDVSNLDENCSLYTLCRSWLKNDKGVDSQSSFDDDLSPFPLDETEVMSLAEYIKKHKKTEAKSKTSNVNIIIKRIDGQLKKENDYDALLANHKNRWTKSSKKLTKTLENYRLQFPCVQSLDEMMANNKKEKE